MLLGNGGYQRISSVDHIAHVQSACLGEQLVGIPTIVAVLLLQPQDQLGVRDAGRVFHGTRTADYHDSLIRLDARPLYRSVLDHLEHHGYLGSDLHRDSAQFSLPLPGVAITCVDERAGIPYGQVDRVARPDVRHIHVAPEGTGARAVIASRSGATARVPRKGSHGSFTPSSSLTRLLQPSMRSQIRTLSGSGSCSVRVRFVEVRPPK